ncbi:HU family DNA-binding protein [Rhizobium hainanense]|uniref:Integration host factor subunit beta n=1 Tax=Rhizobium hainanense TaxID=52131 RepID=A0A1C3VJU1_9HYPH|nr:HU family DNA-binding protein [Rhizobium hainanense]SCB27895.1 integration host factor subunit beta [Rhizobium hainanense]
MLKSELVLSVAASHPYLRFQEVELIVETVLDEITETLAEGGRVELRGFGVFSVRNRSAHPALNPKNGQQVLVDEKWVPFFRMGKNLFDRLNQDPLP